MPRITILMPVYNGMPFISEAVDSVLAQVEQNWELIISDNGSTDSTRAYLRTLQDPRISIHLQKNNLGIYGNLNFLIERAHASIAQILCADDKLLPNAVTQIALFMEKRPKCALSRCLRVGEKQTTSYKNGVETEFTLPVSLNPKAALLAYLTFGNPVGNLSQASIRPDLIIKCGGFNQNFPYSGDREAWARVSASYGLELHNEELIFERSHPQQNRILLDKKNENFSQTNNYLKNWAKIVDADDLVLLKRHWTIHFLAQRLPRLVRQALTCRFDLVYLGLSNLPLGISPLALIFAYPFLKLNLHPARVTTEKLLERIHYFNQAQE